jgi:hypothetical protein
MSSHYKPLIKIAVVGDIHDLWEAEDAIALKHLGVDLMLFVGDFGNESVDIVRMIASIDLPKAAIMGNHDAWYSASEWGRKRCPYDRTKEDRVQQQLDLLGNTHVGYGKLDFPTLIFLLSGVVLIVGVAQFGKIKISIESGSALPVSRSLRLGLSRRQRVQLMTRLFLSVTMGRWG